MNKKATPNTRRVEPIEALRLELPDIPPVSGAQLRRRALALRWHRLRQLVRADEIERGDLSTRDVAGLLRGITEATERITGVSERDQALAWLAAATEMTAHEMLSSSAIYNLAPDYKVWTVLNLWRQFITNFPRYAGASASRELAEYIVACARSARPGRPRRAWGGKGSKWDALCALALKLNLINPSEADDSIRRRVREASKLGFAQPSDKVDRK